MSSLVPVPELLIKKPAPRGAPADWLAACRSLVPILATAGYHEGYGANSNDHSGGDAKDSS